MSVPTDSLNSEYLNHIDQTLKSVVELNEMEKKSGLKEGHYYANILVNKDGGVSLEAKKGGAHTSFAELTRLMEKIANEPDSTQKTSIMHSYKKLVDNYRNKERGIFERVISLFKNSRKELIVKANRLLNNALGEASSSQLVESVVYPKSDPSANLVLTTLKTMNALNAVNEKAGIPMRYRVGIKQIAPGEARIFLAGSHNPHANFENATTLLEDMARKRDVTPLELREILDNFKIIRNNYLST